MGGDMNGNETTRRQDVRLPGVFPVVFEAGKRRGDGVAIDLSPTGMRLRTNEALAERATLHGSLTGPEEVLVEFTASVRWVIEFPAFLKPMFAFEAGLHLDSPDPSFLALFQHEVEKFLDYRDAPRIPNLVRIELSGPGLWETTFALNISRRGMYVRTDRVLNEGQFVEVRLFPPREHEPLVLRTEVAHVLGPEQAKRMGTLPGLGLRLISHDAAIRDRYYAYCEYLENRFVL